MLSELKLGILKELFSGKRKVYTGPNKTDDYDGICSWTKLALTKLLCGKAHCHDANSACPASESGRLFRGMSCINVPRFEDKILALFEEMIP
jgi:hypothetical protein